MTRRRAMDEVGIDLRGRASKAVDDPPDRPGDFGSEDPSRVTGSEADRLAVFRRLRDEIGRTPRGWLATVS